MGKPIRCGPVQLFRRQIHLDGLADLDDVRRLCGGARAQQVAGDDQVEGLADQALRQALRLRLAGGAGLVFVTGWDPLGRASLLYALAQAAAAPESQSLMLVGTVFLLPLILAYTGYCYYIFRGKVAHEPTY